MTIVSFLYDYSPCSSSLTLQQQPEEFLCEDQGTPSAANDNDSQVQIACFDDAMNTLVDDTFFPGQIIVLTAAQGRDDLGPAIRCEISEILSGDNGEIVLARLQELRITTAVFGNFYLQDRYGSLVAESCEEQRCVEPVRYTYTITNIQDESHDLTRLMRDRNGDMVSLMPLVPDEDIIIGSGGSTIVIEEDGLNLCFDGNTDTKILAETTPEDGPACEGIDEYSVVVEVECRIDLDIKCETDLGEECQALDYPRESCGGENTDKIVNLRMKYESSTCDVTVPTNSQGDAATCRDFAMPFDRVQIACSDTETEATITATIESGQPDIGEGETVLLTGGSGDGLLPASVTCEIRSSLDSTAIYQVVTFDVSGTEDLGLRDQFGSLQVEACSSTTSSIDCLATICLEYGIQNVGTNDADVEELSRTLLGETKSIFDLVTDTSLSSGQSTVAIEKVLVDTCSEEEYCVVATAGAAGTNGLVCEDTDEYCIESPSPPTASPTATDPVTSSPTVSVETPSPTLSPVELPTTTIPATDSPTVSPTESPVELPTTTIPLTDSPTNAPTEEQTPETDSPTAVDEIPSTAPVTAPPAATDSPTASCILQVKTECAPPPGSETCEEIRVDPVQCTGSPIAMVLLYEGGDCQNSFNAQSEPQFACEDLNGGPPTAFGSSSYVVIKDIRGVGIVYFSGWVEVGEIINILPPGDDAVFEPNQNITIYDSNVTSPENIVQTLVFDTSCDPSAQSLFLKDRFGAMQIVGYDNQAQGTVSCFVEANIEAAISVAESVTGHPISISTVQTRLTATPGGEDALLNFTSDVEGTELASGIDALGVTFSLDLNLTARRTYSVFTTVTGLTEDGRECEGEDLYQFSAGQPPPPLFPTISPTEMPTLSLQPSPDPESSPCELTAVIDCVVLSGGSNTCDGLKDPSDVTCIGQMNPSMLEFQYFGNRCPANPQNYACEDTEMDMGAREIIFIEVSEGDRIIDSRDVRLNDVVRLVGTYGSETKITLYTFENGVRGDVIQILDIPTSCEQEDDLTLLNQYGALELIGFTNAALGQQGISAEIDLIYRVVNNGFQPSEVSSALILDHFDGGPFPILNEPAILQPGAELELSNTLRILNLRSKEQEGDYRFFLAVEGTSVAFGNFCQDSKQLVF